MDSFRRLIPSPQSLVAFEAAARLGSFTRAAEELQVTQAAVSYAIRQLEAALGVGLFLRRHRRVELTEVGERFFRDVALGLAHIRRSAEAILREKRDRHVTLSSSTAFASHWLLPRLARLRQSHPEVDLRLQTTDRDSDLAAEGIALGIRRGQGSWPEYEAALFAAEEIFAVATPAFLERHRIERPRDLLATTLIHLDEPYRPRPTWRDWFAAQNIAYQDKGEGLRLNDYALVLQAALEGQGVALGWRHLIVEAVAQGLLTRVLPQSLNTGHGHYLVWSKSRPLDEDAARVRDWLLAESAYLRDG